MTERREDLSTADLAGQRPAEPVSVEHVEDADPDRPDVDRDGVDETDVDPTGVDRSDLDREDTRGFGARDEDLRDTDRVGDVDTARSDDYDTDVTPVQSPGGSAVADPDALGDRTPAGTGPLNGSTGPGTGTTGPLAGSTGPGVDTTGPDAGSAPVSGTTGPGAGTAGRTTGADTGANATGALLGANDTEGFRARWTDVQTGFVDEPRRAVEQADGLVAELMQHLATTFADERTRLESQWDSGDDVQTDDLRAAFQRYRSFFERLLAN